MVRASIAFFVLAIAAFALGAGGIAGVSMEIGKILLIVFLVLAVISFVVSLLSGKGGTNILPTLAAVGLASLIAAAVGVAQKSYASTSILRSQQGRVGYLVAWLLGVPASILFIVYILFGR